MKKRIAKNMEWSILICTILLVVIGLFAIYSANYSVNSDEFVKQIVWIAISIPFLVAFIMVDYDLISKISPVLYVLILGALVGVLFTTPISGATSWFTFGNFSIQPSEFAKVFVILFLALAMSMKKEEDQKK